MSKIARVKFIRDKEPNIKALTAENKVLDGALYVATDTGTMWMGTSATSLIQIKDNINTNTTYTLTKNGSTITLKGSDGSSVNITDSNTIYNNATASAAGLMSAADKSKLDSVATGANKTVVDSSFVANSTNPVQSKVVKSALDGKSNTSHKHVKADITDFPTSMPASDVSAWAKAATKPSYSKEEVGLGNVDNTADSAKSVKYATSAGSATTATTANALKVTELTTQNLDDTKTIGLYFAGGTNSVKNKPNGVDAFGLEVKKTAAGYLAQVLTEGNTNAMKTWIRQFNGSAWSAWAHYFDSNHTPTWSQVSGKPSFATVATSGSYNDLSNKPTIPTVPSSLKNPNALTISLNGTSQGAYDGSAVKNINITASSIGAAASSHTHTKAQITDFPTSMPASDVYAWAKQSSKPSYSKSEVGLGNVDNTADSTKSVKYAASSNYANSAGKANGIVVSDTRNDNPAPKDAAFDKSMLTADFKFNNKIGSPTGFHGDFCGVLSLAPWSETSGGHGYQLAFGYANAGHPRLALRGSDLSASSWNSWYKIYTSDDKPTLSELGAAAASHTHTKSQITDFPTSMPASDVYAWAKASSKPSYSWSEISNKPTIPSVGNGTVTIKQNGATKGSFTLNQSGNATIELTDNNTVYSLPTATSSTLGGVKVGSNITNNSGTISLTKANVTAALGYTPPTSDTNTWRPEEVIISSTQPSANTCKLWIKI